MFGRIRFNVASPYNAKMTKSNADVLKKYGFKVLDLREADVVNESDNSITGKVYILCCQGKESNYNEFKEQFKFREIVYEGHKTLIG